LFAATSTHRALLLPLLMLLGCHPTPHTTVRLIGGKPQSSRYVSPGAYEHYLRAQIAVGRGELQQATTELRFALAMDGESPFLHTSLAMVLAQAGHLDQAHEALKQALARDPAFPDALVLQGQLFHQQGKLDRAQRSFERCVRSNPKHGPGYLHLADLLEERDRPDQARRVLMDMVKRAKAADEGHERLALLCLRQVDYGCAPRHLAKVLEVRSDIQTLVRLAHVHRALGNMPQAIRLLREAFDRSGGSLGIATMLVEVLHQTGRTQDLSDLLTILETAARDRPADLPRVVQLTLLAKQPARALALAEQQMRVEPSPKLQIALGEALFRNGRPDEGKAQLTRLLDGPEGGQAALRLATLLTEERDHDRASDVLRQALTRHGHNTELVLALSRSLYLAGKNEASVQAMRRALLGRPDARRLRFGLAVALERTGAWRQSLAEIRAILAKRPKDAAAHNFLGYTLADRGTELKRAERAIRRALYLEPGAGYIIDSLGWLYYRKGNWARAQRLLAMAARLSPREPEILEHLAEVNVALKKIGHAIQLLRKAIAVSDDEKLAARLKRRIQQLEQR
jgi:tetratricopeptide (TPR) repeat protein